jgi:PAS domain S-box-containing protein
MNWFAILSLIATTISLLLGIIVLYFNRKALINKIFFFTSLAAFAYAFTTVMMWTSGNIETANFWHKMGTIWPFFTALVLNFSLVFTGNKWIINKRNYLILYLPAVSFWLVDLFTYQINNKPVLRYWGFNDIASGSPIYYLSTIWTAALPVIAFIICFRFYRAEKDPIKKQQGKHVTVGFAIPIATFIVTNMLTRSLGIDIPNFGISATLFFSVFVGYAVIKYELFTIDASLASENIIATIPDAFILSDENGKILRVNDRLVNFLGYSEKELLSKSIADLFGGDETWNIVSGQLRTNNFLRNFELSLKTKNGEDKFVLFSGSIVNSKRGAPIGVTCIMKDITERIAMEQKLLKSERLASIGELAGQIGHDLRNPLSGIKNALFLIKKKNSSMSPEGRLKIYELMEKAIQDSDRIICSLINYSSDVHLEVQSCTPKSLTNGALSKIDVPDRIKVTNLADDSIQILADVPMVESAFGSVIQNAIDSMPENGSLNILSDVTGSNVEISFIDSGNGVPETIQPKLFSPLVTTKAKGMGMSLAICKRIVDAHGGKISFEAVKDQGSKFTFSFPLNEKLGQIPS